MRKLYSLLAALMVAVFALAQTKPTVTVTLSSTGFTLTPNPLTDSVCYVAKATDLYAFSETVTPESFMQEYVTSMNSFKFQYACLAGERTIDFETCGDMTDDGSNTILAATVSVIDGVRTLTSDVVRVDTVFTKNAGGGAEPETPEEPVEPEEPVSTIEPGKYYIATTFADEEEDDQFFASMGSGRSFNLRATLFNGTTPTEIHEFEFEAVEGKQAVFYIKNGTNYLNTSTRNNFLAASTTANEACEWKVVVLDEEEGNVKISHVQTEKIIFFEHYVDEETSEVTNWYVCKQALNAPEATADYPVLIPVVEPDPISATVTMTLEDGKVIVTPTPADAHVYCFGMDEAWYEFEEGFDEVDYLDDMLKGYESADDVNDFCPAGTREICLSDWTDYIQLNSKTVILAAVVAWDAENGKAVRLSDVVRIDTTFTSLPTCGEGDEEGGEEGGEDAPIMTIEPGKYYVSTFMDATTQYLLTTTTGAATVLPAKLYVDANTPTAANEFEFVAVEGQDACFTIQDNTGAFLVIQTNRMGAKLFALNATKPETGAVWKVTLQDALNHVTMENTDFPGDIHCLNLEGEIAYCFGTEAIGEYNLPILIQVPGTSTNLQEADCNRQVIKTIENGQLILNIDGVRYNILGIAL